MIVILLVRVNSHSLHTLFYRLLFLAVGPPHNVRAPITATLLPPTFQIVVGGGSFFRGEWGVTQTPI